MKEKKIIRNNRQKHPRSTRKGGSKKKGIKYKILTLKDIFSYPNPMYLIAQILPVETVVMLAAYAGTGKSIIALSIIIAVLTGKPLWRRFKVLKSGPILLVDEETPRGWLKERLQRMHFKKHLHFFSLHFEGVRLDLDEYFTALMDVIKEVKPVLVVIDSLSRVHRQWETDSKAMSLVMERLRNIANWGTTVLVIHHHRKGRGDQSQMLRGSSDIAAGIDIEYSLTRKGNYLIFKSVKTRTKPLKPIKLRLTFKKKLIKVICKGTEMSQQEKRFSAIVEVLKEKKTAGFKDIYLTLAEEHKKIGEHTLQDVLNSGVKRGILTAETAGRNKKLYGLNPSFSVSRSLNIDRETEKVRDSQEGGSEK